MKRLLRLRRAARRWPPAVPGRRSAAGGGRRRPAARQGDPRPGITATTVTVGGHFPLTGPAAPGYSEIPRASNAYFQHVNANGGVNGRKLKMIVRDDGYNPVNTVKVTKQLVLQDKVFAILGGLGTPTHTKVVDYLNASPRAGHLRVLRLPLLGRAGEAPVHVRLAARLPRRGQDPRPVHRRATSRARRSPTSSRTTTSAPTARPAWTCTCRSEQVVDAADLRAGQHRHRPADGQDQGVRRRGRGDRSSIPAYTALQLLAGVKLDFHPTMVVSNVGSDAITLTGLLKAFSKGAAGASLIDGIVTDSYLPPLGRHVQQLDQALHPDPRPVHPEAADGRQRRLRLRDGLHVRGSAGQGRAEPDPQVVRRDAREGRADRARGSSRSASAPSRTPATPASRSARSPRACSSPRASR